MVSNRRKTMMVIATKKIRTAFAPKPPFHDDGGAARRQLIMDSSNAVAV